MVRSTTEALARANSIRRVSRVGICQLFTRELYDAPSVGDVDHDRDADAVDGWKYEPEKYCVYGDRNVPAGLPLFFRNRGRNGFGHRCISRGDGHGGRGNQLRSTDFLNGRYAAYQVGNGTIEEVERAMNLEYVGYSKSISGLLIPLPKPPPATRIQLFHKGRPRYDLELLDKAVSNMRRKDHLHLREVRDSIVKEVHRLPVDKDASLVNRFLADFEDERLLRMGLLHAAVSRGRMGVVRQVDDRIRELISQLPKR